MILCSMRDFGRYEGLNTRFGALADVLETQNLRDFSVGRHDILGDKLYVIAAPQAATQPVVMLEAHRRYIDVHVSLDGTDGIGWAPLDMLLTEDAPFDGERDFVCYREPHLSIHLVTAGSLAVFFPEDAHAPLLGDGHLVHKCVFKVLVDREPTLVPPI